MRKPKIADVRRAAKAGGKDLKKPHDRAIFASDNGMADSTLIKYLKGGKITSPTAAKLEAAIVKGVKQSKKTSPVMTSKHKTANKKPDDAATNIITLPTPQLVINLPIGADIEIDSNGAFALKNSGIFMSFTPSQANEKK